MGIYLNPGNDEYKKAINSEIYSQINNNLYLL
jgi:hypothetical protein